MSVADAYLNDPRYRFLRDHFSKIQCHAQLMHMDGTEGVYIYRSFSLEGAPPGDGRTFDAAIDRAIARYGQMPGAPPAGAAMTVIDVAKRLRMEIEDDPHHTLRDALMALGWTPPAVHPQLT